MTLRDTCVCGNCYLKNVCSVKSVSSENWLTPNKDQTSFWEHKHNYKITIKNCCCFVGTTLFLCTLLTDPDGNNLRILFSFNHPTFIWVLM